MEFHAAGSINVKIKGTDLFKIFRYILAVTVPIFKKLQLARQIFKKEVCMEFCENATGCFFLWYFVTNRRMCDAHKVPLCYVSKENLEAK
jgi:hypothetical protein